jgi:cytochrome oxidase Cu insertion factor (SCO1/SenC/PrrC family)
MKFSIEAIVALALAVVFALVSFGAIVREQGQSPSRSQHNTYVAANNLPPNSADVLGVY